MGIQLSNIRIKDFRSVKYCEINLSSTNVLIGQNNVGKSNVLRAITIALSANYSVSERDIRLEKDEELTLTKEAIIDAVIIPVDDNNEQVNEFTEFWISVFSTDWISTDENGKQFVGIRTILRYDVGFGQYVTEKRPIQRCGSTLDDTECGGRKAFSKDMQTYISCFYMDAHRDITEDLRNKKSFFGKATSDKNLPNELVEEIEHELSEINDKIVTNTPALQSTQRIISDIGSVIGNGTDLQIEPISRKLNDLQRGMDVKLSDGNSAILSISEQGMGTRSWASVLTLAAYIINLITQIKLAEEDADFFALLALEEPEAHLHYHAQKRLFNQILSFPGQRIVSTHSANIVAQSKIESLVYLYNDNAQTLTYQIKKDEYHIEELGVIQRELIRSRGDILFSSAIVLAEGITEESALPVFFKEYFEQEPFSAGISIVGIGGQRYKAFLHLAKDFNIPWFIFSDGEQATINTVTKAVEEVYGHDCEEMNRVVFLENGDDYEDNLIRSGYSDNMIAAVNDYERKIREEIAPEEIERGPRDFFVRYIEKYNHSKAGEQATGEVCHSCGKPIRENVLREYDGEEGRKRAILDICQKGKAKYAVPIAMEIVKNAETKVPGKIKELFDKINSTVHIAEVAHED